MTRFETFARILERLGTPMEPRTKMLDFGCGGGELMRLALERGIDAYGCDIQFTEWPDTGELEKLKAEGRVRLIIGADGGNFSPTPGKTYHLPFDDTTFDVVISDQVLEHVRNYEEISTELKRVMKPGAVFLHMFPSRYRLIEGHVFVPLTSIFRPLWWLKLWAYLGVRNQYQKKMTASAVAEANRVYLAMGVNYVTMRALRESFREFSPRFVEGEFMRQTRAKIRVFPWIYRTFFSRVMYGTKARSIPSASSRSLPKGGARAP